MVWASGPAPASRYSAWLNKQHREGRQAGRGRGEARIEGSAQGTGSLSPQQAGWPGRQGYRGSPFCFVPSEWGQLLLSGGLCPPSGETVQDPQSLNNLPPSSSLTEPPSLFHTSPSIHLQCQISWGCAVFCRCPGERADVQPEEARIFIVSVARQKRFLLPLRRSL